MKRGDSLFIDAAPDLEHVEREESREKNKPDNWSCRRRNIPVIWLKGPSCAWLCCVWNQRSMSSC